MTATTEAWILHNLVTYPGRPGGLQKDFFSISGLQDEEVLVEPLYGCWEGNMGHAVDRNPIDIASQRGEDRVVIGNAGVVRVLKPGPSVTNLKEGDLCIFCAAVWDQHGFVKCVSGYDAPGTMGLLAKRTKLRSDQLVRIPRDTRFLLTQWAAFSVRYITAWGNWKVASQCYEAVRPRTFGFQPAVWGWGGGTAFAELALAKLEGFETALISGNPERLRGVEAAGIIAIDRSSFKQLNYDGRRLRTDTAYAAVYRQAEAAFLAMVESKTCAKQVSIFVDQIGSAVTPATLKALARPGVITTSGWKSGMKISSNRAVAAMKWHIHVHTHYARREDCASAVIFAEEKGWMPPAEDCLCDWDSIPQLAEDYRLGKVSTYFPTFRINPV